MADKAKLLSIYNTYKNEGEQARLSRLQQNRVNFDAYHMKQDFSYKLKGQSKEYLPKMAMAVEQGANFMQQGVVDMDDWFRVYPSPGLNEDAMKIKPAWIFKLLVRQLEKAGFMTKVGDAAKLGMLGSLMIAKVGGQFKPVPRFKVESKMKGGKLSRKLIKQEDKRWQLRVDLIQPADFRIDPTGRGLYKMQDIYMDMYEIEALSKGDDAIYDPKVVAELKSMGGPQGSLRDGTRARETGQNVSHNSYRKQHKVTEVWGNFIDEDGELLFENCVMTVVDDMHILQEPTENPYWHGEDPFIVCPLLTVPGSVWGKALMDAPAALNNAINEMFNLILDGGIMAVHGIKQLREAWLEDPSQVEDGIVPGDTLRVNSACPPGATALERVDTATVPADGINVFNLLQQEHNVAALTNDFRMGAQPFRQVKATEVVESSQAITSMFSGIAKHVEADFIKPILEKAWKTAAQHMNDLDTSELEGLLGQKQARMLQALGQEELFAQTVQDCAFEVFGISANLNKQKDFTKLQALLQTVSSVPMLAEEFQKKFDFGKLLGEIMKSLDINTTKIEADDARDQENGQVPTPGGPGSAPGQAPGEMPDAQSQIPQAGAAGNQAADSMASAAQPSAVPSAHFPPSPASRA
jgi:hypothetical protein